MLKALEHNCYIIHTDGLSVNPIKKACPNITNVKDIITQQVDNSLLPEVSKLLFLSNIPYLSSFKTLFYGETDMSLNDFDSFPELLELYELICDKNPKTQHEIDMLRTLHLMKPIYSSFYKEDEIEKINTPLRLSHNFHEIKSRSNFDTDADKKRYLSSVFTLHEIFFKYFKDLYS